MIDDATAEFMARAIYDANPRGVWNNRVDPMVFSPYAWSDLDPDLEQPAYVEIAKRVLASLDRAGYALTSPGHVMFPRSRKEAEAMNVISERFLTDNDPKQDAAS